MEMLPGFGDVPAEDKPEGFLDWDGDIIPVSANPMVHKFGAGPEGRKCKECAHFFRHRYDKVYRKCKIRGITHGPGTDHNANYDVCKKFEEKKEEQEDV